MAKNTGDDANRRSSGPDYLEEHSRVSRPPVRQAVDGIGLPSSPETEPGQEEALRDIPDPSDIGTVTHNYNISIGVLAENIRDSTVDATGRASWTDAAQGHARNGAIVWQASKETLEQLRDVYVPPSITERAQRVLARQHVLVLHGRAHWGKATTAMWLLAGLHNDALSKIEPAHDRKLSELTETLGQGGYLIDTLARERVDELRVSTLSRLAEHLRGPEQGGHLVITVDGLTPIRTVELVDYLVKCDEVPNPIDVLQQHLTSRLGDAAPSALESADKEWLHDRLENRPAPARMRDLAAALTAAVRGAGGLDIVKREYEWRAWRYVAEWFENHPSRRERCFMLAVAVLNGTSYEDVADAADELEKLIQRETLLGNNRADQGWSLRSPRLQRVQDASATVVHPEDGERLVDLVVLEDPVLQPLILAHAWWEHDDIFRSLLEWLNKLGHRERFEISGRAAAAVGMLCTSGLDYLVDRLLRSWAIDKGIEKTTRISAAVSLVTAAQAPALTQQILRLLRRWTEPTADPALAWTATTTYGLLSSESLIDEALAGLRRVTETRPFFQWLVARSLANLCEAGYLTSALAALADWIDERTDTLGDRALNVFYYLTRLQVNATDDDPEMPFLLHLAAEGRHEEISVPSLWQRLRGRSETRVIAQQALHRWLLIVDDDERCSLSLDRIVLPLLKDSTTCGKTRRALRRFAYHRDKPSEKARQYLRTTGSGYVQLIDQLYAAAESSMSPPGSRNRLLRRSRSGGNRTRTTHKSLHL